jgi:hypothetical protein
MAAKVMLEALIDPLGRCVGGEQRYKNDDDGEGDRPARFGGERKFHTAVECWATG